MQNILKAIGRRRTALGFGVHSPFAFRFITEVLCPPRRYGYYAYERTGTDAVARLAVRLMAYFNPASIACSVSDKNWLEALLGIASLVVPAAEITHGQADMLIIDTATEPADLSKCRHRGHTLIIGRHAAATAATIAPGRGKMIFTNDSDIAVVAALPHLPFTVYHLTL